MLSQAAKQFQEDFPDVYWAVPWFKQLGHYTREWDNGDYVMWEMIGYGITVRLEGIPERCGGGEIGYYYDNKGVLMGTSMCGDFYPAVQ